MKKVLGIDYGERRMSIAISDSLKIIATPLTVIDRKKQNYLETIQQIIIENNVELIIVGLPITLKEINLFKLIKLIYL